ncbi:integrase/recombinase XerD [Paenibacillus sp. PastF-3]|uniref:tyrosine-type recombinase/integrase n=1 Tax=Paenibacillus sp. PastF-3 TaxID=2940626 RepID=UPI0024751A0E|nr:tyrosine-type recombinase/integrase [Paenibacillus sp. PastF-3]MDH6373520.1 integrase/recombinase XerD [Paenibacillus sp. PastF-3]
MNNVSEQLLSDVVAVIYESFPELEVERTKSILSAVVARYHIQKIEEDEPHPDSDEKIKMFLSSKRLEGLSPLTLDGYALDLHIFFKHVRKRTDAVTAADIRAYLGQFDKLKMSTIGKKLSVLKSFFGWLTSEEILPRDPSAKLKTPKLEKRMPKALTIPELEMLREACKTVRQRAFIEVMYATGCRLSEVYGMDRDAINHQSMSCRVIGKGNKEREVYFSFKAMYHLMKYLKIRTDDCEALMVTERKPHRRLTKRGIQREISVIARSAGLQDKVSPHVLRHTFATLTLNNGAELVAVQELMGHSDPQTTLRYARITEDRKREQHKRYLVQ